MPSPTARLRTICLALPESFEKEAWGDPTFRVRDRIFAMEKRGVVIKLAPGVVVKGRVMGRDGPVRGARIVANEGSGESARQVAAVYADRYGEYALRALSGKITLSVSAPGYRRYLP